MPIADIPDQVEPEDSDDAMKDATASPAVR